MKASVVRATFDARDGDVPTLTLEVWRYTQPIHPPHPNDVPADLLDALQAWLDQRNPASSGAVAQ